MKKIILSIILLIGAVNADAQYISYAHFKRFFTGWNDELRTIRSVLKQLNYKEIPTGYESSATWIYGDRHSGNNWGEVHYYFTELWGITWYFPKESYLNSFKRDAMADGWKVISNSDGETVFKNRKYEDNLVCGYNTVEEAYYVFTGYSGG